MDSLKNGRTGPSVEKPPRKGKSDRCGKIIMLIKPLLTEYIFP